MNFSQNFHMIVQGLAVTLQSAAVICSLFLLRYTQERLAWFCISLALMIMTLRRFQVFERMILGDPQASDFSSGWLGVTISTLLLAGFLKMIFVSEARKKRERELGISQQRMQAISATSEDAIVTKDLNGIVQEWNQAAETMFGYTAQEIIGKPITLIIPPERLHEEDHILNQVRRGVGVSHLETERVRKDGTRLYISVSTSPIRDDTGEIIGAAKIARDVTEKTLAARERESLLASEKRAREDAQRAGRMKDEFLATLSHELRSPLNAILGWTQLMRKKQLPDQIVHGLDIIERNARSQSQIIGDLLDMNSIISGKVQLNLKLHNLTDIIKVATESVAPAAADKNIRLINEIQSGDVTASVDAARLQQILWNLLSNAIKFTPENGEIKISLKRESRLVEILVTDTGEGIKKDFLPYVFAKFSQADASTTRRHGGLGLGLSIVKSLAELHGGTVKVDSDGEGKGATFTVHLPVSDRAATPHDKTAVEDEHTTSINGSVDLRGVNVLVVDDHQDSRELVRGLLEASNATVVTAASANEGLKIIRQNTQDVLISDIGMPEVDGYEFVRNVRRLPAEEGGNIPAVALTAFARAEDRKLAFQAGYQMQLAKPFEPGDLLQTVASVYQSSRG